MFEKIYNVATGETIEVPYSKEQIAEFEANQAAQAARQAEAQVKAQARAALLSQLGITEEQAKLLLGGN